MKTKRKFNVTAVDIREGMRENCGHCPTARSIKRTLKIKSVLVEPDFASFMFRRKHYRLKLPEAVTKFINEFDTHGRRHCKPFTFTLELMRPPT